MMTILHSFGAGLAFCFGIVVGAWIVKGLATRQNLAANEKFLTHAKRVEDRLEKYVEHSSILAEAAQVWMKSRER